MTMSVDRPPDILHNIAKAATRINENEGLVVQIGEKNIYPASIGGTLLICRLLASGGHQVALRIGHNSVDSANLWARELLIEASKNNDSWLIEIDGSVLVDPKTTGGVQLLDLYLNS